MVRHPNKPFNHILNNIPQIPDGLLDMVSPTSSKMKSTFIMTNGTRESNDLIYKSLSLKKKHGIHIINASASNISSSDRIEEQSEFKHFVKTGKPAPRDGHSATLVGNRYMLLFGGDRHHMPFNDLHILDLYKELDDHMYLFE